MGEASRISSELLAERSYFRTAGELSIRIPALPRAECFAVERDTSPTEAITLELTTIFLPEEERDRSVYPVMESEEYESRIASTGTYLPLGYQHREWLLRHWDEHPALYRLLGELDICFPGSIMVRDGGVRCVPILTSFFPRKCDGGGPVIWVGDWKRLDYKFTFPDLIAVARR
ncbi:MAG: hypothetical protein WBM14_06925 [Terracidiphilus sp.]